MSNEVLRCVLWHLEALREDWEWPDARVRLALHGVPRGVFDELPGEEVVETIGEGDSSRLVWMKLMDGAAPSFVTLDAFCSQPPLASGVAS